MLDRIKELEARLESMTKERDDASALQTDTSIRLGKANEELAALRQPVGSKEERDALDRADYCERKGHCNHLPEDSQVFEWLQGRALCALARALRAKTAALEELVEKAANYEMDLVRVTGELKEAETAVLENDKSKGELK